MWQIQAILFDKNYWDLKTAKSALKYLNIKPMKHHITEHYIRFRINTPDPDAQYITEPNNQFKHVKIVYMKH